MLGRSDPITRGSAPCPRSFGALVVWSRMARNDRRGQGHPKSEANPWSNRQKIPEHQKSKFNQLKMSKMNVSKLKPRWLFSKDWPSLGWCESGAVSLPTAPTLGFLPVVSWTRFEPNAFTRQKTTGLINVQETASIFSGCPDGKVPSRQMVELIWCLHHCFTIETMKNGFLNNHPRISKDIQWSDQRSSPPRQWKPLWRLPTGR